jgi:hypothetical protein
MARPSKVQNTLDTLKEKGFLTMTGEQLFLVVTSEGNTETPETAMFDLAELDGLTAGSIRAFIASKTVVSPEEKAKQEYRKQSEKMLIAKHLTDKQFDAIFGKGEAKKVFDAQAKPETPASGAGENANK